MSAINDIISGSFRHMFANTDDQVNKLHFRVATPPSPNNANSHLEDLGGWFGQFYGEFENVISNSVDAVDLTLYNLTADAPQGQTTDFGTYTGGTASAEALPPQDTMLVLLYTGVKRVQGRIYLPTFTEAHQSNGVWGAGTISSISTAIDFLTGTITGPNGGEYTPVVWSPTNGIGYPILSYRVQPLVATMKSRKRGRGS